MTTWTDATDQSTTYTTKADTENGYVVFGYVQDGYFLESEIWSDVDSVSTVWA